MSVWTHVSGVLQLGRLNLLDEQPDEKMIPVVKEILGDTISWRHDEGAWNIWLKSENKVPGGDEGSIQYKITQEEEISGIVVVFWGDLRGRGKRDSQEIKTWFLGVCEKWQKNEDGGFGVNSALMEIRCSDSNELEICVAQDPFQEESPIIFNSLTVPAVL